jgi:hypothetical protein
MMRLRSNFWQLDEQAEHSVSEELKYPSPHVATQLDCFKKKEDSQTVQVVLSEQLRQLVPHCVQVDDEEL